MKTWKVRYYVRNLITFAVVHAESAEQAKKQVQDTFPRNCGIASVEEVK